MAQGILMRAGGVNPSGNAQPNDVLKDKTFMNESGEELTGTLALSGNADANSVLSGLTFYSNDPKTKKTGTMVNNGAINKTITPSDTTQYYYVPHGYHNGNGKVTVNPKPSLQETVLWSNPSPTSSMSGKTLVTLSSGWRDKYEFLKIEYRSGTGSTADKVTLGGLNASIMIGGWSSNASMNCTRNIVINDTSIDCSQCYGFGSGATVSNACVPLKLVGINGIAK